MSQLVGIIGKTGEGKSRSIKTLNPAETFIINVADKPLPWRGSMGVYNSESKNYLSTDDHSVIVKTLQGISDKAPHIKNIIIEDGQYLMSNEFMRRTKEIGFGKFTDIGLQMFNIFTTSKKLRKDLKIFYITHSEDVVDNNSIASYKMKTIGNLLDNYITLEGLFTVCLYTHVDKDKDGRANYSFITNRWDKYPAKSPEEMFPDIKIPNDLEYVSQLIDSYYNYKKVETIT